MLLLRFRRQRIVRAASVLTEYARRPGKTPSGHKDTSQQAKTRMGRGGLRGGSTSFGNLARRPPTLVSTYIRILDAAAAFSGSRTIRG